MSKAMKKQKMLESGGVASTNGVHLEESAEDRIWNAAADKLTNLNMHMGNMTGSAQMRVFTRAVEKQDEKKKAAALGRI
jgi:hypothetical protein